MIIWINGAFGSGKTQTAHELHRRLPHSFIYDPEEVGFMIRKNTPSSLHHDNFQDHPLWRHMNYELLKDIAHHSNNAIIIPMTVFNSDYFHEIVTQLRNDNIKVDHYLLSASKETILKRLKTRFETSNSWAAKQLDDCLRGFEDSCFETKIETDLLSISDVVDKIATHSHLDLSPDHRSSLKKHWDKLITKLKHIR